MVKRLLYRLSYAPIPKGVAAAGLEPATWRVAICSSTGIRPGSSFLSSLARLAGIEPATRGLTIRRSTAELQPIKASSSAGRGRPVEKSHGDKREETVSGARPASEEAFSVWALARRGVEPTRPIRGLVPCSSFSIRRVPCRSGGQGDREKPFGGSFQAMYSHGHSPGFHSFLLLRRAARCLVCPVGFEPTTNRLRGGCSDR